MLVSQTGFKHEPILKFKNGGIQVTLESCLIT